MDRSLDGQPAQVDIWAAHEARLRLEAAARLCQHLEDGVSSPSVTLVAAQTLTDAAKYWLMQVEH